MSVSEVVAGELIVRFDGTVAEVWLAGRDSERFHAAHVTKAELLRLDERRGPTLHIETISRGGLALTHLKMEQHQLADLQRVVGEIDAAARGGA